MNERNDSLVAFFRDQIDRGADVDASVVATALRSLKLASVDAAWVLRHLFDLSLPDAWHLAKISEPWVEMPEVDRMAEPYGPLTPLRAVAHASREERRRQRRKSRGWVGA